MHKRELLDKLKIVSDAIDSIEHQLPYDYQQHDPDKSFLAQIRQQLYSIRCGLGGVRETIKDPRNWAKGCDESCEEADLQQW